MNLLNKIILNRLQKDIPFVERPWKKIAEELNLKEDFLIKRIAILKKKGIIRRISANFTPQKIGCVSTLAAVRVVPGNIRKAVNRINSYPEVTHNYRREAGYNIWFALVAKNRKRIARIIEELKKDKHIAQVSEFPTIKLFKIDVNFKL